MKYGEYWFHSKWSGSFPMKWHPLRISCNRPDPVLSFAHCLLVNRWLDQVPAFRGRIFMCGPRHFASKAVDVSCVKILNPASGSDKVLC